MSARDPHSSPTSPQRSANICGGIGTGNGISSSGKLVSARVILLNDSVHNFQVPPRVPGRELYYVVMKKLQILESDYFDLEYVDKEGIRCWLDHDKPLSKQFGSCKDLIFSLGVKFYTPHPNLLEEEYTRYLFALQIKKDIVNGFLPCNENTSALLASYLVQMEIGDFLEEEYHDHGYLKTLKILHNPSDTMLLKVMEYHKTHIGLSPAEAEFHLLDTARKVELYGIRMHPAKDHEGLPLNLAVAHMGIIVFQNSTKINTFSWAKIRKLSFKRKKFLIKLHPEGYVALFVLWLVEGYYKDTVEFYFESRDECKNFWKKCIEHHAFFRCQAVKKAQRRKARVVSKGSSFRYSGRTQKQLIEYVRENSTRRPFFERSSSCRVSSKSPSASRHSSRLPPLHSSSHSGGSTTAGVAHIGTLNSSASARSRTVSTSSGSHTMASSREHIPHLRSVSQSPPARRAPAPSRSRSLGAEGDETLHPGAPASDAQSHRPQTPQHRHLVADNVPASSSGTCGQMVGDSSGGGGTSTDLTVGSNENISNTNANDTAGTAVTLGRVLCIDRVSYSTSSVSHTSSESDENRQQQQRQQQRQTKVSHFRSSKDDFASLPERGKGDKGIEQQKYLSDSLVDNSISACAVTTPNDNFIPAESGKEEEIPYVLHKRHISPSSNNRLFSRNHRTKSPSCLTKSPRVLREEYLSKQRRVDRGEIEQLKAELRSHGPLTGPVSAYRLPPVNAYSALDDTLSSPSHIECPAARLDLLNRLSRPRTRHSYFTSLSQPNIGRFSRGHRQPLYQSSSSDSECSIEDIWVLERKCQPDSVSDFEVRIQTPHARSLASSDSAGSVACSSSSLEARLTLAGPGICERRNAGDSSSSSSAAVCGPSSFILSTAASVADVLKVPMDLSTTSESSGGINQLQPRIESSCSSSSANTRSDSNNDVARHHLIEQDIAHSRDPSISSQLDQIEDNSQNDNTFPLDNIPELLCRSTNPTLTTMTSFSKSLTNENNVRKENEKFAKSDTNLTIEKTVSNNVIVGSPPPPPPEPPRSLIGSSPSSSSSSSSVEEVCIAAPEDPYEAQFESSCTEADGEVPLEEEERHNLIGTVVALGGADPMVYLNSQYRDIEYDVDGDDDDDDDDDEDEDRDVNDTADKFTVNIFKGGKGSGNSCRSRSLSSGKPINRFSLEETVERNLQCGIGDGTELIDSSLEKVPSDEDGDEVDEFVLDEESSSTDNDSDDESASEGSEEIEPFPPPPPELLAFSEEDEEAVAAAERSTNGYHLRNDNLSVINLQQRNQQYTQRGTSPQ